MAATSSLPTHSTNHSIRCTKHCSNIPSFVFFTQEGQHSVLLPTFELTYIGLLFGDCHAGSVRLSKVIPPFFFSLTCPNPMEKGERKKQRHGGGIPSWPEDDGRFLRGSV